MNRPNPPESLRAAATEIWWAGVDSVEPERLVPRCLATDGNLCQIDSVSLDLSEFDRIVLVGGGKATAAMARGWIDAMRRDSGLESLELSGWINVPEGEMWDHSHIKVHAARPAAVNEPTPAAITGTRAMMDLLSAADSRTLGVVLISGGGSALISSPIDGVTLDEKLAVIRHLSGAGATIEELNAVRTRLSQVKGGGLARAFRGRELVTLVLSDVLGDPLEAIASGPTILGRVSPIDPRDVLARWDPDQSLPQSVYRVLASARSTGADAPSTSAGETSFANHVCVIGNNAIAVDEAGIRAESLGYNHLMHCQTDSEETAEAAGRRLADTVWQMLTHTDGHRHDAVITGGEPVVQLADPAVRGRGGRNQQLILEAYRVLRSRSLSDGQWDRIVLLSGGTDGEDGPTDAAGAMIDVAVHRRVIELGLDVDDALRRNDAYTFFELAGGLFKTGLTGTNVCDLRVGLVGRPI